MFNDLIAGRNLAPSELTIPKPTGTELGPQADLVNSLAFPVSTTGIRTQVAVIFPPDDCNRLLAG